MSNFEWIDFYSEFATVLLKYRYDRARLVKKIKQIYINTSLNLPSLEKYNQIVDIDPFTIFGLFNFKGITDKRRVNILVQIKELFAIKSTIPTNFEKIPLIFIGRFYLDYGKRGSDDIDNLWLLFQRAISYADNKLCESDFITTLDTVSRQKGIGWNITIGLSWIRPFTFLSLDASNRRWLVQNQNRFQLDVDIINWLQLKQPKPALSVENYLLLMKKVKEMTTGDTEFLESPVDELEKSAEDSVSFCEENLLSSEENDVSDDYEVLDDTMTDVAKNTILYGPPGTGKTYHTIVYAVAIVENEPLDSIAEEAKKSYSAVLERYNWYKADGLIAFTTFHQSYGYEEFIEGIKPVMSKDIKPAMDADDTNGGDIRYTVVDGLFKKFCNQSVVSAKKKNRVFIIDEINRGNISKIFGELITLIEPSKRMGQSEGIQVKLPYSQKLFGVPDNVYIIGTMNTADRSIATIDTALRRRFRFQEMMPDAEVLKDIRVEDISVAEMLVRINQRISVLYDREHTIGHAYFMPLKENPTIEQLAEIFEHDILPLLQEYFYEDYEKIRLVLGDNQKENREEQIIRVVKNDYTKLFGSAEIDLDACVTYEINREVFHKIEAYRSI